MTKQYKGTRKKYLYIIYDDYTEKDYKVIAVSFSQACKYNKNKSQSGITFTLKERREIP